MQLAGKRIIITGGAQGIGEATVRAFAAEGAQVTSMDLNAEAGAAVAKEASEGAEGSATFATVDVADRAAVTAAFDAAATQMGGLDVMVNVAGYQQSSWAEEISDELYERIFSVNVLGTIHTNQAAYKLMKPQGTGAILNFGSMSGFTGELTNATYGSSKGAVHTWTRTVAREWGPQGIRVNAILPYVNTPMFDRFRSQLSEQELADYDAYLRENIPLGGTFGNALQDLAPVLVFMASDASHFITGQLLPVDGGFTAVR